MAEQAEFADIPSENEACSEDEEFEEEEEEEQEPMLKYERSLKNDITTLVFENTEASFIAVHEMFIALGDTNGQVFLLDHVGNLIRQINAHKGKVTCISIDPCGEYLASCSHNDSTVMIKGLYNMEKDLSEQYRVPVYSVALGPDFATQNHYAVGTDKLLYNEKGFFSLKRVALHAGEGPVWTINWKNNFIAWANDMGVKIYDTISKKLITKIGREPKSPCPKDYQCHLTWHKPTVLLVGWANTIKVCEVRPRTNADSPDLPPYFVEVLNIIYLDHYVAGIGPLSNDKIITLGYQPPENNLAHRPCVIIRSFNGEEVSVEELSIRGYEQWNQHNYKMASLQSDGHTFIMSPKDIVVAKPRDKDDHVEWLIQQQDFDTALEEVRAHQTDLNRFKYQEVGQKYFHHLRTVGQFEKAAKLCSAIIGDDKELWHQEVIAFGASQKLTVLSPYIPFKAPQLEGWVYELVLSAFLKAHEFKGFENLVKTWPSDVYKQQPVINYLTTILQSGDIKDNPSETSRLLLCLGLLYEYQEDFVLALFLYIKLSDPKAFELISKYDLFASLEGDGKILRLMKLNEEKAIELYTHNTDKIPVSMVVTSLSKSKRCLHNYLDKLFEVDLIAGADYHKDMIELYAEYDQTPEKRKLMRLLKDSTSYPIDKAYEVCAERKLYEAQVYLLTRMGHSVQALSLLIDEIKDIAKAIEFCKEQDDKDLWDNLLKKATESNKPTFITGLLNNIGTHINPKQLIANIPNGQKIPGLRDSLVKILCDYNLQIHLSAGCKKVFVNDTVTLSKKMKRLGRRGISVDDRTDCQYCKEPIVVDNMYERKNVMMYFCGHAFHEDCVHQSNRCISCHK